MPSKEETYVKEMLVPSSWLRVNIRLALQIGLEESVMLAAHCEHFFEDEENPQSSGKEYKVSRKQLETETGIASDKQEAIEDRLIDMGVLERTSRYSTNRNRYIINEDRLDEIMDEFRSSL